MIYLLIACLAVPSVVVLIVLLWAVTSWVLWKKTSWGS